MKQQILQSALDELRLTYLQMDKALLAYSAASDREEATSEARRDWFIAIAEWSRAIDHILIKDRMGVFK